MVDIRLKKVIVAAAVLVGVYVWWAYHPHSMKAAGAGIDYQYVSTEMSGTGGGGALPLIIALHGNGDTARNFTETLFRDLPVSARIVAVQGPLTYRQGHAWPMAGPELKTFGDALAEVVPRFAEKYRSSGKPVLVGFSGGACMAYYQAAAHGDLYANVIAVAGRLDESIIDGAEASADSPDITILHGRSDGIMSYAAGKRAAAFLADSGWNVRLIDLPGDHLAVFTSGHAVFMNELSASVSP